MNTRTSILPVIAAVVLSSACETATPPARASFSGAHVASPEAVTFTKHIAPLLQQHCQECHRPDSAAPFSLLTYDDAHRRRAKIHKVTERRKMPPWKAVSGYGEFADVRRLSDEEIGVRSGRLAPYSRWRRHTPSRPGHGTSTGVSRCQ